MNTLYDLNEVKNILNVDYSDDDVLLQQIILTAQAYIDANCGEDYKNSTDTKYMELAKLLFTQIVTSMYEHRETTINSSAKNNKFYVTIMQLLSLVGENDD